ncbi:LacI family DNA-binding transcriptional regulator [Jiella mangrovi]|uniref:LacI family DNA-binding transcriptional regulator n=1 Tax=Jiella mangrovi TaxID=2821407 RepID=A0ABS4BL22_9HYPH|nr:LacI family DNA-binding transcriptional regulator [Jiella mangrovi]MBP0616864.1 LacI family DNA-binding transcriptional regulator [Jiella mangrovi]
MATTRKRVTLLDVARHAGVSRATASLVVRQSPLVGETTRQRVVEAMRSLGYVYNAGAARLRRGTSRTVGVIVPNLRNPFFAEMLDGIETVFDTEDMAVMLANTHEDRAKQDAFVRRMREHDVDGVIVCPAAGSDESFLETTDTLGLTVVQALRWISQDRSDYAGTNYADGMRQAVEHLKELGHRRIAFVAGDRQHSAFRDRLEGYRNAIGPEAETIVVKVPLTHEDGRALAGTLMRQTPPSAAICFNDVVALGLLRGLFDLGVDVGRDFSLVGFDNVPEAALSRPALTSVTTNPFAIGEAAARLLLRRLADPEGAPKRTIEPTRLVIRESTGPCPESQAHAPKRRG